MGNHYDHNLQYLVALLNRLDLLIELCLLKFRRKHNQTEAQDFRGLYISEQEIITTLKSHPVDWPITNEEAQYEQEIRLQLAETSQQIHQKTTESLQQGMVLYLPLLGNIFELSHFEIDCLLICLAPELNLKYEKLYAYLQDDVTRKRPTVQLLLDLLCQSFEEEITARSYFASHAPLLRYQLLQFVETANERSSSFLSRSLKLDERISQYLLGSSQMDFRISSYAKILESETNESAQFQDVQLLKHFFTLTQQYLEKKLPGAGKLIYFLHGSCSFEQKDFAKAISHHIDLPLLFLDLEALLNANLSIELALQLVFREALLQPAVIYIEPDNNLHGDEIKVGQVQKHLFKAIDELGWLAFIAGAAPLQPPAEFIKRHFFIQIDLPAPSFTTRKQIWDFYCRNSRFTIPAQEINELANKFRFSRGQIQQALHLAKNLTLARLGENFSITSKELYQACRILSNQNLGRYAQKIQPRFIWDDLILPEDQKRQLHEICQWVKYYQMVFADWGFERKLSLGKGLNILFAGPSGTGKTMASEIIAGELGLELYKIDLSMVVSKYIGETEKNLSSIFQEAATSNAILFFDEADALFGKRTEVKDAHDRYANIEINYLLLKMEEHEGIVILATNMKKNLDDAFMRRLHFAVEFPLLDEQFRLRIWRGVFPQESPHTADIDFHFLAKRFKLSGGNIKNIAINAAFLAAENSGIINMEHIILATRREFQKMGRSCVKSDFEQYFDLVKIHEETS